MLDIVAGGLKPRQQDFRHGAKTSAMMVLAAWRAQNKPEGIPELGSQSKFYELPEEQPPR